MSANENTANIPPVKEQQQTWFEWLKDNKFSVIFGILVLVGLYYWYMSGSSGSCSGIESPIPEIPTTTASEGGFIIKKMR